MPGSGPSFTQQSANALLPELRILLLALRNAYAVSAGHGEAVRTLARGNGGTTHAQTWADAERTLAEGLRWLQGQGILLKDPERGLVDFPSVRDGRPVLLCWKMDEPSVDHWHEVSEGFAGRQPL
jgi:hypothetical protein